MLVSQDVGIDDPTLCPVPPPSLCLEGALSSIEAAKGDYRHIEPSLGKS